LDVFDEGGEGVVLGEGVGMVMVKRVKQGLEEGDTIYGVVKGAWVNKEGRRGGGGRGNVEGEKEVMKGLWNVV
ncbi:hypothetical protein, partial [Bacillus subtilis]|uniref:hypothetical protein n=1 Tax=Bacillus subtilis TaxID=1423 RepID=UPI0016427A70